MYALYALYMYRMCCTCWGVGKKGRRGLEAPIINLFRPEPPLASRVPIQVQTDEREGEKPTREALGLRRTYSSYSTYKRYRQSYYCNTSK